MSNAKGWREVQKANKLLRETHKLAKDALNNRDPEQAKILFAQCVRINKESSCGTGQEMLECNLGLADSCLAVKDFEQAEKSYKDCLDRLTQLNPYSSQHSDTKLEPGQVELVVSLMVKRARALEGLAQIDAADSLLAQANLLAKSKLVPGHLLVSNTLQAHASLLRKHHRSKALVEALEEAARANQAIKGGPKERGDYNELILDQLGTAAEKHSQNVKEEPLPETKLGRKKFAHLEAEKPPALVANQVNGLVSIAVALILLSGAVILLVLSWNNENKIQKANQKKQDLAASIGLVGREYRTSDREERITFPTKTKVVFQLSDLSKKASYVWQEKLDSNPGIGDIRIKQVNATTLIDDSGSYLYSDDAPENQVIEMAETFAGNLNSYYQTYKEYPASSEDLKVVRMQNSFINPYTGKEDQPCVLYLSDSHIFQKKLDQAIAGQSWDGSEPSTLEVAVVNDDGQHSYVIRIRDRYGKFVTSSVPEKFYALNSQNGDSTVLQGTIEAEIDQRKEQLGGLGDKVVVAPADPQSAE